MIPSIFLLFVAAGIVIGSFIVGYASIGALIAGVAGLGILTASVAILLRSRQQTS